MSRSALVAGIAGCVLGVAVGYAIAPGQPISPAGLLPGSDRSEQAAQQVREILADSDPLRRAVRLGSLLSRLDVEAVPAVTAEFDRSPLNRGAVELVLLGSWWGRLEPEKAWDWTRSDWRADYSNVMGAVARAWAHRDPAAALEHAAGVPFRGQAQAVVAEAMAGWEEAGHPGLLEYIQSVPDQLMQQKFAETLAQRRVLALGAEPALAWADALSHDFAVVMRPRVASAVAEQDPKVAAAWAEPRIAAASRPTGLPRRIGTRWVKRDPEAAMGWLASLPAGGDRDDGVTETIRTWAQRDRFRARMWIEALAPEPWNEPIRAYYATSILARNNPKRALELVAGFVDEDTRNYHTTVILRSWIAQDRPAADAWVKQAKLPPDVRERAYMGAARWGSQGAPPDAANEQAAGS